MALRLKSDGIVITEAEYLASEPNAEIRREYLDGRAYAMAGAKRNHRRITDNLLRKFGNHLESTPCEASSNDAIVALGQSYVYPDVVVDCINTNDDFVTAPVIIVEVLSNSSRKLDTTTKLLKYINLATLKEYVLVEQDIVSVQVLRNNNDWKTEYYSLGDNVTFESIELTLSIEEIYERVNNAEMNEFRQATLLS